MYYFINEMENKHDSIFDDDIRQWAKYVVKRVL